MYRGGGCLVYCLKALACAVLYSKTSRGLHLVPCAHLSFEINVFFYNSFFPSLRQPMIQRQSGHLVKVDEQSNALFVHANLSEANTEVFTLWLRPRVL